MATTTRRQVLGAGGVLAAGAAVPGVLASLAEALTSVSDGDSLPARDPAGQLLSRASYGVTPDDLAHARAIGPAAWLEEQLDPDSLDDSQVEDVLAQLLPTLAMSLEAMVAAARADPAARVQPFRELEIATLYRALHSRRQLYQVMVEFWSDHFSVNAIDGPMTIFKPYEDRVVMRRHALGSFRELLQADARSPAMLYYLDNISNVAAGPNENYARELLELHTLGIDGGYTQADVEATARIFTGWGLDRASGTYRFDSFRHDYGAKEVLGVGFPAGRGESEGEALLDLLAAHPATARHLATKLARRFVADAPPTSLVERMAAELEASGGDIPAVLRVLFGSDELAAAQDAKLKRPFDYVVSVMRASQATISERGYRELYEVLQRLGQLPFTWPAPNGFPSVAAYWRATSTLLTRWNFALGLADGTFGRLFQVPMARHVAGIRTPVEVVDRLIERVLGRPIAASDRQLLIDAAAVGIEPDTPLPLGHREEVGGLVLGLILVSRYFQLR